MSANGSSNLIRSFAKSDDDVGLLRAIREQQGLDKKGLTMEGALRHFYDG